MMLFNYYVQIFYTSSLSALLGTHVHDKAKGTVFLNCLLFEKYLPEIIKTLLYVKNMMLIGIKERLSSILNLLCV